MNNNFLTLETKNKNHLEKTKLNHSKHRTSLKFLNLDCNKTNDRANNILKIFNEKIESSIKLLVKEIEMQELSFKGRLRNKLKKKMSKSVIVKYKSSTNKTRSNSTDTYSDRFKKTLFTFQKCLANKYSNYSNEITPKNIKSLNNIFEEYLSTLEKSFFKIVVEKEFKENYKLIDQCFKEKLDNYYKHEDDVKEMELTFNEDLRDFYQRSIDLMINNIYINRDTEQILIQNNLKNKLKNINKSYISNIEEFINNTSIIDNSNNLIQKLIDLFNIFRI